MTDSPQSDGFDFNRPTIIALLYLVAIFTALPLLIGVVLAYIWKGEQHDAWEDSHFRFHIRTFWMGIAWAIIGGLLTLVLVGFVILALIGVWMVVRTIKALLTAQRRAPIENVETWLF